VLLVVVGPSNSTTTTMLQW